jgi:hypothetical protein
VDHRSGLRRLRQGGLWAIRRGVTGPGRCGGLARRLRPCGA